MRILAVTTALLLMFAGTAGAVTARTGPWRPVGSDVARPLDESQGLAVVERPSGTVVRYTGIGTVPPDLAARGWNHVGDPGAGHGYYVEPYQRDDRGAKLFRVESPAGAWTEYQHALEPWEALNNSFAAVSPDGQWLLSGEYGTADRLLVHPMPGVAHTDPGANLPLASVIRLDRPMRDVQGCDFVTATQLVCSSDDPEGSLFGVPKPLLQVDLAAPVGGTDVTGAVTLLGQLPLESGCTGDFEAEGLDFDERDGTLRVVVMSPSVCIAFDSKTWRFQR